MAASGYIFLILFFMISLVNLMSNYRKRGEVKKGVKGKSGDVLPDIATSFTILLAIFFPSVTGMCSKVVNVLGGNYIQKQSSGDVLKKRCSENIQQIYRRTPMPKFDFNAEV